MDKCFFCDGNLAPAKTNYMTDRDGHFIIVKNVPCFKCDKCGEISYSGDVTEKLEGIILKLQDALTEVAIVNFNT